MLDVKLQRDLKQKSEEMKILLEQHSDFIKMVQKHPS